jgi:crotonobetainyl-CoA:carnitine CoA-transferase CaiB-like acyl-CoA transferase
VREDLIVCIATDSVPCEFAGRLAVDAGCEVVKLEPPEGDPMRGSRGPLADWLLAGKRSAVHGASGLHGPALQALLQGCDALLVDEAGRDWVAAHGGGGLATKLVVVGERDGAVLAGMPANRSDEFLAFHGAGLGFLTPRVMPGYPSAGPLCPDANLLEFLAGLHGAIALFALLGAAPDSGIAQATVGLCGAALPLLRREIAAVLLEGARPHRAERIWKVSPAEVHRCRDGWLFVDVIEDAQWERLCDWIGRPDLGTDARYATRESRFAHAEVLCDILDRFFAGQPQACWIEAQRRGVPVAPVNDVNELLADDQLEARGFWGTILDDEGRSLRAPLTPLARLFARDAQPQQVARIGEHTAMLARRPFATSPGEPA